MPQTPLNQDVAVALSRFYTGGWGPTHAELHEVFARTGLAHLDPRRGDPQTTKEVRVRAVLTEAVAAGPETAGRLVESLLARMRVRGCFDPQSEHYPNGGGGVVVAAQRAFRRLGWELDAEGHLAPAVLTGLDRHLDRRAIEAAIERIRRAPDDAALLIGTAKELLEATCRYVLEEIGQPARQNADFPELLHLARDRLDLLPRSVPPANPTARTVREVYDGLWKVAKAVNELRNTEGTGHGRTAPPTVSSETARVVVQAAGLLSALLLDTLDARDGARR
jgi:Abortive infection C-terminus